MIARLIVFESNGGRRSHRLSVHAKLANQHELKLVMETSAEPFEPWLFFFLRDHGAYIETTDPVLVAKALNLAPGEDGIVAVQS